MFLKRITVLGRSLIFQLVLLFYLLHKHIEREGGRKRERGEGERERDGEGRGEREREGEGWGEREREGGERERERESTETRTTKPSKRLITPPQSDKGHDWPLDSNHEVNRGTLCTQVARVFQPQQGSALSISPLWATSHRS